MRGVCGGWRLPVGPARSRACTTHSQEFRFDGIYGEDATQEDVFDGVARDAVDAALAGFNSTVFAYGQTGAQGWLRAC